MLLEIPSPHPASPGQGEQVRQHWEKGTPDSLLICLAESFLAEGLPPSLGGGHHWHAASHRRPPSRSRSHWHHPRRKRAHHWHPGRVPSMGCWHHSRDRRAWKTGGRRDPYPCRGRNRGGSQRYLSCWKAAVTFQSWSDLAPPSTSDNSLSHPRCVSYSCNVCPSRRWRVTGEGCITVVNNKTWARCSAGCWPVHSAKLDVLMNTPVLQKSRWLILRIASHAF